MVLTSVPVWGSRVQHKLSSKAEKRGASSIFRTFCVTLYSSNRRSRRFSDWSTASTNHISHKDMDLAETADQVNTDDNHFKIEPASHD